MIPSLLARHPEPLPTESLLGYVVRLTEANGCNSPRELYRFAGMNETETSASNFSCSKFAAITPHPVSWLERFAFKPSPSQPHALCLLGNTLGATDLNLTGARVCPDCVAEKGYIEAHWHIDLMVACPIHKRPAVWYCPRCKDRLCWMRSGLLTCKCGAPFQPPSNAVFTQPELRLLELIRRKALGDQTLPAREPMMLDEQLATTSLCSLLSLIRFLGKYRMIASWSKRSQMGENILRAAAVVFTDWPVNFQKLLHDLSPQAADDIQVALVGDFADIYTAVSNRAMIRFSRR
jgi:TniQ